MTRYTCTFVLMALALILPLAWQCVLDATEGRPTWQELKRQEEKRKAKKLNQGQVIDYGPIQF